MASQTQRKLGPTQRRLLWGIAQDEVWTLARHGILRDRSTVVVVLASLDRRGLARPAPESGQEDAWRLTPAGARQLLDLWPRLTQAGFHAALRQRLIACAEQAEAPVAVPQSGDAGGRAAGEAGGRTAPEARLVTQARGL